MHYDDIYNYGRPAPRPALMPVPDSYEDALHAEIDDLRAQIVTLKATLKMVATVLGSTIANIEAIN